MPNNKSDIESLITNSPLFQNAAKQTDDYLGSNLQEQAARHTQQLAEENDNISKEKLLRSFTPSTEDPHSSRLFNTPETSFIQPSPSDRSKAIHDQLVGSLKNIDAIVDHSKDWAKPYGFNTGVNDVDYDRFYYHPKFKELGYSPFRDNETLYNSKASWWDDFTRMRSQWMGLAGEGFKSMIDQWKNPLDFSPNTTMARSFEKKMGIMSSSKSGLGGSLINFLGNTAYTVGILGDMVGEEAVLLGATALTLGADAEITAPKMFHTALTAGVKIIHGAEEAEKFAKSLKGTIGAMQSVKTADEARTIWNTARKLGGKTVNFLNPLRETTGFLKDVTKGEKAVSNLAFITRGVGSFYKDVRMSNAAFAEARLEGGTVKNDLIKDLTGQYYNKNGKLPEGDEAKKINDFAVQGGIKDALINVPMIYYTNELVLGKAFHGWVPSAVAREMAASEAGTTILKTVKDGKPFYEAVEGIKKFAKSAYWKQAPARIASDMLRYTSANFAEGAQETVQDIISGSVKDYYNKIYGDPALAGHRQAYASFKAGTAQQASGQGAETFLSGFFMGALLQGPQNLIYTHGRTAALKAGENIRTGTNKDGSPKYAITPGTYAAEREARQNWISKVQNSLNDVASNPKSYFKALEENMSVQNHLASAMDRAADDNNRKEFEDAKNDSMFQHIYTLMDTGHYDHFIDALESLKELKPNELGEAFNEQNPDGDKHNKSIHERIDSTIQRAKDIKDRYEEINRRFIDDTNPHQFDKDKEPEKYKNALLRQVAFREAKMHAAFGSYAFDDAMNRMSYIITDATTKNKPLAKVSSTDIGIIFDPFDRTSTDHGLIEKGSLSREIETLKKEVQTYETGSREERTRAKNLRRKMESLDNLQKSIWQYDTEFKKQRRGQPITKEDTRASKAALRSLQESYYGHMKLLAEQNGEHLLDKNLQSSASGLADFIELNHESANMARYVNYLHDPNNFLKYVDTFDAELGQQLRDWKEKNKAALEKYISRQDVNLFFNLLFNKGVFLNADKVDDLVAGNYDALEFTYATTGGPVDKASDKFKNDIQPVIDVFRNLQVKEQPVKAEPVPEETTVIADKIVKGEQLTPEEEATRRENAQIVEDKLKEKAKEPTITEPGEIIYATPGTGKSPFVKANPDKYVDGDQIIFNYLKDNDLPHTTVQHAGMDLSKTSDYYESAKELKQIFQDIAKSGKTVLTASWFARDIADKVYLSKDKAKLMEVLRARGESNVDTQANKIIDSEASAFAMRDDVQEIPSDVSIGDVLSGAKPTVTKGIKAMEDTIAGLDSPKAVEDFFKKIDAKLDEDPLYLDKYNLNITDVMKMLNKRAETIAKTVTFANLKSGDYIIMKDKTKYGAEGIAKVLSKSNKDKTVTIRKFGNDSEENIVIEQKDIDNQIESHIVKGMKELSTVAQLSEEERAISKENVKTLDKVKDNPTSRKAIIENIEKADQKQIDDEFDNSIGCK